MKKYFILIVIHLVSLKLFSQDLQFEQITTDDGLSQASVTCITQDSTGFMWFGTYDGLNRYDGYNFKKFKHDLNNPYSISHNFVRTLLNDSRNLLWVGTEGGGLSLYDHETEHFIHVSHGSHLKDTEGANQIFTLLEDKNGAIWVGTWGGGLFKIVVPDKYNNLHSDFLEKIQIRHFKHEINNQNSIISNKVSVINQDNNGMLWIASRGGISILDPGTDQILKCYRHDPDNPHSLSYDNPSAIEIDKFNNIWIATWGGGLNKYDPETDQFIRFLNDPNNRQSISYNILLSLFSDDSGYLWIGTWGGGLNLLDCNNNNYKFSHYTHNPNNEKSINGDFIYDIYQDRTGVFWIGTDWKGISKYNPGSEKFKLYNLKQETNLQLSGGNVTSICEDKYNKLWIGTLGDGIIKYDLKSGEAKQYLNNPENPFSISNNTIRAIIEDKYGNLWFGTDKGLNSFNRKNERFKAYFHNPVSESQSNVRYIFEDSGGKLWIAGWEGGLNRFDPKLKSFIKFRHIPNDSTSLSDNTVWSIAQDKSSHLWIGTNNGLNLYNTVDRSFRVFKHDEEDPNSLTDSKILSLLIAQNGDLLIGTTTGFNILEHGYDLSKKIGFQHITPEEGLTENTVQGIMEDNNGNYWLNNGHSLTLINNSTGEIIGYSSLNILNIGELNINSRFKNNKSGHMFVGGIDGFVYFHPDSIKKNRQIPNVVITDIKVLYNSIVPGDTLLSGYIISKSIAQTKYIRLSYNENNIAIDMSALHFNAPQNNLYKYRLMPIEKDWEIVPYNSKTVKYNNLNPGEYNFQFSASNNDGVWNDMGNYLQIYIEPPYWQAWWFRIAVFLLILGVILWAYKYRIRQIKRINLKLEQRVQERTVQLANINQELESFTYSVSHDLRAPLRAINGFSHALKEDCYDKLDNKGKDYIKRILLASLNMGSLIDELLKLSRISKNNLKLETINLSEIVLFLLNSQKQNEPDRKTKFTVDPVVRAIVDKGLFEILLRNLIDNAWKFTSKNKLTEIEFGKLKIKNETVFFVKDNGIGFDMNYVDKLFEPFQRQNTEYEGTGIGLAIVNRIIKRHGGRVWAEGESNKGSIFYFTLP